MSLKMIILTFYRTIAIFVHMYQYHFFLGQLHDVFEGLGCQMMGYTSQDGYEHEASKAIRGDKFCGLLCDEVNEDDLTEERVKNWVEQLKSEGITDGGDTRSVPAPAEVGVDAPSAPDKELEQIADLERENARLRQMIEDSKMMDEVLKTEIIEEGFVPHYNPKTFVTMWTSTDGKKCYYTKESPRSP